MGDLKSVYLGQPSVTSNSSSCCYGGGGNNNNNNNKGDTSDNRGDWDYFKSFRKYVRNIAGKRGVKELQKTAILGTAHILRKVLM